MEYSSTKPLGLQVYKTPAEFKALRLNRTEQCRLDCTRTYLSRQERNFHKDFKTTRAHYQRRFSVFDSLPGEGVVGFSPGPFTPRTGTPSSLAWSTPTTPRSVSAASLAARRRVSEIPASSSRRSSVWSLPGSAARADLLQRRRQTYGGVAGGGESGSVHLSLRSAGSYSRRSFVSEPGFMSARRVSSVTPRRKDDDLGDRASEVIESHNIDTGVAESETDANRQGVPHSRREGDGAFHDGRGGGGGGGEYLPPPSPAVVTFREDYAEEGTRLVGEDNGGNLPTHREKGKFTSRKKTSPASPHITFPTDAPPQWKPHVRVKTAGSRGLRRFSKLTGVMRSLNGITKTFPSAESISPGEHEDRNDSKGDQLESVDTGIVTESSAAVDTKRDLVENVTKVNRKVSIKEPSGKVVQIRQKTQILSAHLHPPASSTDCDLETDQDTPSMAEIETLRINSPTSAYRENSVAFVDPEGDSESFGVSVLRGRVSRFLDQQRDFNKRFPLTRHEVTSLECSRPDLLNAGRAGAEVDTALTEVQESMIAETLAKLGMEDNVIDVERKDKKLFPPLN